MVCFPFPLAARDRLDAGIGDRSRNSHSLSTSRLFAGGSNSGAMTTKSMSLHSAPKQEAAGVSRRFSF
jgi:hypothetical protein